MSEADDLRLLLKRIEGGSCSPTDLDALRRALRGGSLVLASGQRAVAVGGDANGATLVTGDGNVLLHLPPGATGELLAALFPVRPYQLPADLADFTGRKAEIDSLLKSLRSRGGGAVISAVAGMGGVGKTVLAVHVAHCLRDEFCDGQIIVDLRGTLRQSVSPTEAMGRVIHAFLPQAQIPKDEGEATVLYRSVLDGRRALLLLDNAADAAQVRPLVPPAHCAMLVTSRQTIFLDAMQTINIDALPPPEALALLRGIVPERQATDAELGQIAALCGQLPLALRIAGAFLVVHRDWTAKEYITPLTDKWKRLGQLIIEDLDVEAVLGLSARQLMRERPDLGARWRELTLFPADFDRAAAVAVWGFSEKPARDDLSALLERNLLLYDEQHRRYRLHDLMGPVAREVFGYAEEGRDPDAEAGRIYRAAARHATYFKDVLAQAEALYLKGGEHIQMGLALFEIEWLNIRAGQAWAAAHAQSDDEAARLTSCYSDASAYVLDLRLHSRERITWLEGAITASRRLGVREAEGNHLEKLGIAYWALGEARRALEFHEQHMAIARETGDRRGEGTALGNLGLANADLGDLRRAIEFHEQALAIAREIGDRRGEGMTLGNLGAAYWALGAPHRAIEFHEQNLAITREIGHRRGEGIALGNLGAAYGDLGASRRAIEFYGQALAIAREIGDRRGEAKALGNIGTDYAALGDPRSAMSFHEEALAIARGIGDRHDEGTAMVGLANAHFALGSPQLAIEFYEQGLAIARQIGHRRGEGIASWNMAQALDRTGRRSEAIAAAETALANFEQIEDPRAKMARRQLAEWREE